MGTLLEFPADAATRRLGATMTAPPPDGRGTVLILPVIRIERHGSHDGSGPEEGASQGRRRRRRARS